MAKSGRPRNNSAAVTTDPEIKNAGPVEMVKPEVKTEDEEPEKPVEQKSLFFGKKTYTVINKAMAGKSVTGSTGEIIAFDENGKAKVGMKDADHLSRVPGYSVSD